MTGVVTFAHAQPFTADELEQFEMAVIACNNHHGMVAELARTALGAIFKHHGKAKCDLMMAALDAKHGTEGARQ